MVGYRSMYRHVRVPQPPGPPVQPEPRPSPCSPIELGLYVLDACIDSILDGIISLFSEPP